ncbi:MAG: hypothetical protein A4E31_00681 [Methanomassiliicoccales archaeon PtaU1.Bin030]|nr:MAG: hypothetical protein A4E31_00681 [Methanomassiliicoccales archaeon PtaU1.Bin030]
MLCSISANSFRRSSISRPVRARSLMSRMALACTSSSSNLRIRPSLASSVVRASRMMRTASSRESTALISPCRMWSRALACRRSYWVRRVTTSLR